MIAIDPAPQPDDDSLLAAEHALGLVTRDEARVLDARLARDPAFRAHHVLWTEAFARLGQSIPPVDPPADLEQRLRRRLFPDEAEGWWRRTGLVPALVSAAVAGGLVLAVGGWDARAPWMAEPSEAAAPVARSAVNDQAGRGFEALLRDTEGAAFLRVTFAVQEARLIAERPDGDAPLRTQAIWLWLLAEDGAAVLLGPVLEAGPVHLTLPGEAIPDLSSMTLAATAAPLDTADAAFPSDRVVATGPVLPEAHHAEPLASH
ncbi:MAG: hypothetical protein JJT81_18550 [Rubellimicrobium sp.]|nr:hypothetical protein [Rubellimicrobium sp.]